MEPNSRGLTLIELLIAIVISAIFISAVYRTFLSQQKTYRVQEQMVDMQQNMRVAINKMMREIRMAGFGKTDSYIKKDKMYGTYEYVVTPENKDEITVVGAYEQVTLLANSGSSGSNIVIVDCIHSAAPKLEDHGGAAKKQYLCFNGTETNKVKKIRDLGGGLDQIELFDPLKETHHAGEPIFRVQAITYSLDAANRILRRNTNLGGGRQPVAENIEDLEFKYVVKDGTVYEWNMVPDLSLIRRVQVRMIVRSEQKDPDYKSTADGYRRRELIRGTAVPYFMNVQLRNLTFE